MSDVGRCIVDLLSLYYGSLLLLAGIKVLRHSESDIPDVLSADDVWLWFLWIVACHVLTIPFGDDGWLIPTCLVLATLIALWVEAALFSLFGVSPDIRAARRYWEDIRGAFTREKNEIIRFMLGSRHLPIPFVAGFLFIIHSRIANNRWCEFGLIAIVTYALTVARSRDGFSGWLVYTAAGLLFFLHFAAQGVFGIHGMVICTTTGALFPLLAFSLRQSAFLQREAREFLGPRSFLRFSFVSRPRSFMTSVDPLPEDCIDILGKSATESALCGACRNRSIVLITLESIGLDYFDRVSKPFYDSMARNAMVSKRHFCITPVTTASHAVFYSMGYSSRGIGMRLARFIDAGYLPIYLTADDTRPYRFHELLARAGFQHIFDGPTIGVSRDEDLIKRGMNAVLESCPHGPVFLHVHTANTHFPYSRAGTQTLGRVNYLQKYLQSLEDADCFLADFVPTLLSHQLFSDAVIVITGDHGQAFGEFGYRTHCNAIIREEINVPFLLWGKGIPRGTVTWSSHFDVLPTLEDLAGILNVYKSSADYGIGASLFTERNEGELGLLLYSEALKGGYPTNYGIVIGRRKIMIDRIFGRVVSMTLDDSCQCEIVGDRRRYFVSLIDQYLKRAGVVT